MVTPPKGDYASVPLNDEGRRVADQWDPAQDGACEAYGAAALLRMPTRLRIRWDGDARLVVETDAGRQVRNLDFGAPAAGRRALAARPVDREMGDAAAPGRRAGARGRRRRRTRSRRRLPRGQDDEPDRRLAAPQRRAVQRGRRRHGILRAFRGAERGRVADGYDDRRRPAVSHAALRHEQSLPHGARRRPLESARLRSRRHERAQRAVWLPSQSAAAAAAAGARIGPGRARGLARARRHLHARRRRRQYDRAGWRRRRARRRHEARGRPRTRCSPRSGAFRTSRSAT